MVGQWEVIVLDLVELALIADVWVLALNLVLAVQVGDVLVETDSTILHMGLVVQTVDGELG